MYLKKNYIKKVTTINNILSNYHSLCYVAVCEIIDKSIFLLNYCLYVKKEMMYYTLLAYNSPEF